MTFVKILRKMDMYLLKRVNTKWQRQGISSWRCMVSAKKRAAEVSSSTPNDAKHRLPKEEATVSGTILTRSSDFAMHQSIASRQFKMLHIFWEDSQPAVCYVWLSLRRTAAKLPVLVLQFLFSQFSTYFFNFKASSLVRLNFRIFGYLRWNCQGCVFLRVNCTGLFFSV